jgi:hypothetical protein
MVVRDVLFVTSRPKMPEEGEFRESPAYAAEIVK